MAPYCGQDGQRLKCHSSRVHFDIAVCTFITTLIIVRRTQLSITISVTIALFLQPCVLDSTLLRALTASSFFLSGASIASASVLVALKDRMLSMHKRDQWIDASTHPKKWSSVGFWGCLTWPFTSLVWSVYFYNNLAYSLTSFHAGQ